MHVSDIYVIHFSRPLSLHFIAPWYIRSELKLFVEITKTANKAYPPEKTFTGITQ